MELSQLCVLISTLLTTWNGPLEDLQNVLSDQRCPLRYSFLETLADSVSPDCQLHLPGWGSKAELLYLCSSSQHSSLETPSRQEANIFDGLFLVSCLVYPLTPSDWKTIILYILSRFSSCFQCKGKSGSCYSLLAGSRTSLPFLIPVPALVVLSSAH